MDGTFTSHKSRIYLLPALAWAAAIAPVSRQWTYTWSLPFSSLCPLFSTEHPGQFFKQPDYDSCTHPSRDSEEGVSPNASCSEALFLNPHLFATPLFHHEGPLRFLQGFSIYLFDVWDSLPPESHRSTHESSVFCLKVIFGARPFMTTPLKRAPSCPRDPALLPPVILTPGLCSLPYHIWCFSFQNYKRQGTACLSYSQLHP